MYKIKEMAEQNISRVGIIWQFDTDNSILRQIPSTHF